MPYDPTIALKVAQPQFDVGTAMQNALAIRNAQQAGQLNQLKLQQEQQAMQEAAGLQNYLTSANLNTPEGLSGLYRYGTPGAATAKSIAERQAAEALTTQRGAEAEKFKTETKAKASETAINKANSYKDMLNFVRNPQDYAKWVQMQRNDPDLVGTPVHDISDEDLQRNLDMIPTDQAGFDAFKGKAWMGIDKWTTSQQQAATAAETKRHNIELEKAAQERIASTGLNAKDYPNVAQAIIDGRLAPNRVNSRNASILEQTLKLNPDFDLESATATAIGTEAGSRTLGTVGANQATAGNEAATMIPIARLYADKVGAGQFKSMNDLSNWASKHTGDKAIVQLNTALNSLVNSYARAINPRGMPTVSDKNHAREILDAGLSNGQLNATLDVMEQEIAAARAGTAAARSEVNPGSKTTQAGGGAQTPTKSLDDIFKKKTP